MSARYAIYFAPPADSALARFGVAWLGRDSETGSTPELPRFVGFSRTRQQEITATARHYGFHATLKPPFSLAPGKTVDQLDTALSAFAKQRTPIDGLGLKVGGLDGFLALVLTEESSAVLNLAADCVRAFDAFRNPPSPEELARRRQAPLSELEDALLRRWGYPYVMEAFRFHMTLTCRLTEPEYGLLETSLRTLFGPIATRTFGIDGLSLFHQEVQESPFRLLRRYAFADAASSSMATNVSTDRDSGPSLTSDRTSSPST